LGFINRGQHGAGRAQIQTHSRSRRNWIHPGKIAARPCADARVVKAKAVVILI
jgi:hypothetical protein